MAGWFVARADPVLRRWFQVFLLLFVFQWWMALGLHTLVAQLGRSFHWPEGLDFPIRALLSTGAGVCLGWGVGLLREGGPRPRAELAFGLALAQVVAAHSLFAILSALLPIFRGMRSPGHFFDLASFPFFAMLGVAVARGPRRAPVSARAPLVLALPRRWCSTTSDARRVRAPPRRRGARAMETQSRRCRARRGAPHRRLPAQNAPRPPSSPPGRRRQRVDVALVAGRAAQGPYLSVAMTPFLTTTDDPRQLRSRGGRGDCLARWALRWVLEDFITVPRLRPGRRGGRRGGRDAGAVGGAGGPADGHGVRAYALFVGADR